jgi:hypothetical protein
MNIHLSEWSRWEAREELPDRAGVYVIAKGAPGQTIYIGKTWGGDGLRGRIRQFNRSATTGADGHAGGVTFNEAFGATTDDLYVSVHAPVAINESPDVLYPYISYVERRLIWEYVEKHGKAPVCNKG